MPRTMSGALLSTAVMGTALIAATPAMAQARWGSADQPIARSYGWSSDYNSPYYYRPRYYGRSPYSSYNYYRGPGWNSAPAFGWGYYGRDYNRGWDEFGQGMRFGNSDLW